MTVAPAAPVAAPMPAAVVQRLFFSINEVRAALGCARSYVYELIAAGDLDCRKMGGKSVVTAASLQAYALGLPLAKIAGNAAARSVH